MKQSLLHFNRGRVDPLALARVDQKRVAISADIMTNWVPRILGPMSLRPGWEYINTVLNNNAARYLAFIFSTDDTALIEVTQNFFRVVIDDVVLTRPSVTTAVMNGDFTTDIVGWTDNSDPNGTADWETGGFLELFGNDTDFGIVDQQVTTIETGTEHALRIVITRGPVVCSVGSSQGVDDYVSESTLQSGHHSLAFTPTGNFHIRFKSATQRKVYVDSCVVETWGGGDISSVGIVQIPAPWTANDLENLRYDQSGDVLFVACKDFQQRRIERRSTRSWSIVTYVPEDGPFQIENVGPVTLRPGALTGNTTLTASQNLFKSTNVGSLYRLESKGQTVTRDNVHANEWTDAIKVTGITSDRIFTIVVENLVDSTVNLQRSLESETGPWSDVPSQAWTADITKTFDDGLDNQIVWYRIGIKSANYGTDDSDLQLIINTGSITGVCRATGFTGPKILNVEVIEPFGNLIGTDTWAESVWSARRGWPTSVGFYEGRLWWAGQDRVIGSISDAFNSFNPDFEGDAGPINRTIGSGPVDTINWIAGLQRLLLGGQGAEFSVKSSSFDEPLTPTNFNIKSGSTQGSAAVPVAKVDQTAIYVQRGGTKIYELALENSSYDYGSSDLTVLVPEMGEPGIVRLAVQRQQDTRLHCLRSDGTVMLGVYDKFEDVLAWQDIETDGQVEDVVILPGTTEDQVYYLVRRTIDGSVNRYLEKWAVESDCRGGTLNKQADSFKIYSGSSITNLTGLDYLEGKDVVVWADGADVGTEDDYTQTYTVTNGSITLAAAATDIVVGLPYTAQFKSARLGAQQQEIVTALNKHKRIDWLSFILAWVHPKGLRFGPDFDTLDDMPEVEEGTTIDPDTIRTTYNEHEIMFPGEWEIDTRICLQAQAPRPVTVMAAIPDIDIGG